MAEGTEVVSTAEESSVAYETVGTTSRSVVSTDATSTRPDVNDKRVRDLQSIADKKAAEAERFRSERDQAVLERARLQERLDQRERELSSQVSSHAEATQAESRRAEQVAQENAVLKAELNKTRKLAEHPELTPYADLLPTTTDEAALATAVQKLLDARKADLEAARASVPAAYPASVTPANPARVPQGVSGADLDSTLKAAMASPREFEETLQRMIAQLGK